VPDPKGAEAIDDPSPARLYATLVGGLLVIAGIVGFFYSASFGSPGKIDDVLGVFSVNAWDNVFHVLAGALGLLVAGYAARRYALWLGILFLAVGVWGLILGDGDAILGFFPVNTADDVLHLTLGMLGVAAAIATPKSTRAAHTPPPNRTRTA
jgi:Domain of unknown function (DUF4383)